MQLFDHFVLAAADLQAAKAAFAELSGCTPQDGGSHTGLGTHNALCSFGSHSYLEIVAPDPAQNKHNPFTSYLSTLNELTPLHWAIRSDNLSRLAAHAGALGLAANPIRDTQRRQPDGTVLQWQLMGLSGAASEPATAGLVPFFIDWMQCPHPATTSPLAASVTEFTVSLPDGPLHELLQGTQGVNIQPGAPDMRLVLKAENGEIVFAANHLRGFNL